MKSKAIGYLLLGLLLAAPGLGQNPVNQGGTPVAGAGLAPRDNLNTADGVNADFNPSDPAVVWLDEEFPPSGTVIGSLAWSKYAIGAATSGGPGNSPWPHLGMYVVTTAAVAGQGGTIALDAGGASLIAPLAGANTNWVELWIFQLVAATSNVFRIGFITPGNTAALPANGLYLRADQSLGTPDTNFMLCSDSSSVETCQDSGVAIDTNWHEIWLRSVAANTLLAKLDRGAEYSFCAAGCSQTATPPAVNLAPGAVLVTNTTATRTVYLDKWALKARGLVR